MLNVYLYTFERFHCPSLTLSSRHTFDKYSVISTCQIKYTFLFISFQATTCLPTYYIYSALPLLFIRHKNKPHQVLGYFLLHLKARRFEGCCCWALNSWGCDRLSFSLFLSVSLSSRYHCLSCSINLFDT